MRGVIVFVILGIVGVIGFAIYSEVDWHRYAAAHHCQQTGDTRDETYFQYVFDGNGSVIGFYPVVTTEYLYACDDSTRHWH